MTANSPVPDYRFGRFELQPAAQRLLVDGIAATVGPRAFDVLVTLVERAGQLVSKAELLDLAWPGLVVEENNLQVQVSALRKILGPDAITTIPGRGYRFTLPLEPSGPPPPSAAPAKPLAPADADTPSIAVLPFVNISEDPANEYFADGLAEELLDVLSKIRGLRVTSRTSAFSFKGTKVDIPTVARKLNVANILEGSVRKAGSRVRITAQLVHVATDSHLWSQTYDRELEDIFAVQDDIAHSVVKELRAALLGGRPGGPGGAHVAAEVRTAVKGRSKNAEAYRRFLQGSFFQNLHNETDMAKAIANFRRASALCNVHMYYDWDWKAAETSMQCALQLAPDDSQLIVRAACLMQNLGRHDEAEVLATRALALDPLSVDAHIASGWLLGVAGRLAESEAACRKALELSPQHAKLHSYLSDLYLRQGRPDDALQEAEREVDASFRLQGIALAELARGRAAESDAALGELIATHGDAAAYQIAWVYARRGDAAHAFEWLERAYRQRDAGLASMKIDHLMRNLHDDPRWQRLLQRMRLAD
jgi:TolB-like protein